jgi:hypothetical protein
MQERDRQMTTPSDAVAAPSPRTESSDEGDVPVDASMHVLQFVVAFVAVIAAIWLGTLH